ncbi:MAG TPA: ATPase, T2SS/T4P/T4SS family [Candidatus Saccharimonas sp.]|nr:ATPase, T2SS/T4P/T4SS family [Candidatus Saccharimonas sp.]
MRAASGSQAKTAKKVRQGEQSVSHATNKAAPETVSTLLEHAIKARATAIHIEPQSTGGALVRYRIDGVLSNADNVTRDIVAGLLQRFKTLSGLRGEETQLPQDGHFKMRVGKSYTFTLHVATMPVNFGEKLVVTLQQDSATLPSPKDLGLWGDSLSAFTDITEETRGLIVVGGLYDAGTSTTAYVILQSHNVTTHSLASIEDSISHPIAGASQTLVNRHIGLTHASGLRALLKQDTNTIMVDDIREPDTAHITATAALGGHLLIGVVRAPSAVASIVRLQAMGIEPFVLASTLRVATGQYLVRKLCDKCKQQYTPSQNIVTGICNSFGLKGRDQFHQLIGYVATAARDGIGVYDAKHPPVTSKTLVRLWQPSAKGCNACNHTGFKGRIGLFEILTPSAELQKLITGRAPQTMLHNQAVADGMVPVKVDGLVKSLLGLTTVDEVIRAVGSTNL